MKYKLIFKEYSEALKQNKLLALKCNDCGALNIPPKMVCGKCASSNMDIVEIKGEGKIKTFTVNNVPAEGREKECPYTIVMVELDAGPWIMGNLTGLEPAKTTMDIIGKNVKMVQGAVFAGDKFSAGEGARPVFNLVA